MSSQKRRSRYIVWATIFCMPACIGWCVKKEVIFFCKRASTCFHYLSCDIVRFGNINVFLFSCMPRVVIRVKKQTHTSVKYPYSFLKNLILALLPYHFVFRMVFQNQTHSHDQSSFSIWDHIFLDEIIG